MHHISKLPHIGTSIFSVMSSMAQQHQALNLSQGFPNFESDPELIKLVSDAMKQGHNQYAPMPGTIDLRVAISNKFDHLYQSTYHPETEITVTAGATQAIYTIITAFVHDADEVIIFHPAYDSYEPSVRINGGIPVSIQLEPPFYNVDWALVKSKMTSKTKMIIINTPQNPSGTVFSKNDMLQLQSLIKGTNIVVLSDEVYEHIIFDNHEHYSACAFSDLKAHTFVVASFGKTFHNTGWKMGYCCAPKELMDEFRKVHQFNVFSANHPVQTGLAQYLQESSHYEELSAFYQHKRDLFLSLVQPSRFKFTPAQGTYFQVLDYSDISSEPDLDFAKRLTVERKIASIPLSSFNKKGVDHKALRFCFAKTDETLMAAADILNKV